jgi:hypothetical protein
MFCLSPTNVCFDFTSPPQKNFNLLPVVSKYCFFTKSAGMPYTVTSQTYSPIKPHSEKIPGRYIKNSLQENEVGLVLAIVENYET